MHEGIPFENRNLGNRKQYNTHTCVHVRRHMHAYVSICIFFGGEKGLEEVSRDNFLIVINVSFLQVTQSNPRFYETQLLGK